MLFLFFIRAHRNARLRSIQRLALDLFPRIQMPDYHQHFSPLLRCGSCYWTCSTIIFDSFNHLIKTSSCPMLRSTLIWFAPLKADPGIVMLDGTFFWRLFQTRSVMGRLWDDHFRYQDFIRVSMPGWWWFLELIANYVNFAKQSLNKAFKQ